MHECVDGALDSGLRIDVDDLQRRELGQGLRRDLEQLVRAEAAASSTFVPRKLEVSFKSYELAPGVAVSGKIDRVDADPLSARGIVVDYKSGAAPSASQIHDEARLQIPLYLLVLRDQLGLEPMGGVYMPLGGGRRARGLLRAGDDQVPGFAATDYLDGAEFEAEIEHARGAAVALAERIRAGDVAPRPSGRRVPRLVRPVADVPQGAIVSTGSRTSSSRRRSRRAARRSSPPAPAPARRPFSSSASRAPSSTTASTSTRCS